jgi:hypothetical protein
LHQYNGRTDSYPWIVHCAYATDSKMPRVRTFENYVTNNTVVLVSGQRHILRVLCCVSGRLRLQYGDETRQVPYSALRGGNTLGAIAAGADGNMWFTEAIANKIAKAILFPQEVRPPTLPRRVLSLHR